MLLNCLLLYYAIDYILLIRQVGQIGQGVWVRLGLFADRRNGNSAVHVPNKEIFHRIQL